MAKKKRFKSGSSTSSSPTPLARGDVGMGTRLYGRHKVSEAARRLDKTWKQIDQMIAAGKLILDSTGKQLVESGQHSEKVSLKKSEHPVRQTLEEKERSRTNSTCQQESGRSRPADTASALKETARYRQRIKKNDGASSAREVFESQEETETSTPRIGELEDKIQTLRSELEREQEGRKQDNLEAQYELDQLGTEIENLHLEYAAWSEDVAAELKQERALHAESEQQARELQDELDEERALRLTLEEPSGVVPLTQGYSSVRLHL